MIETGDNMDSDFEDLKEQNGVDNSELEEIMKREITPESQRDFLEILKDSQLFMPVIYSDNLFEGIENAEPGDVIQPQGQISFDINCLASKDGTIAVPLFTSSQIMEQTGLKSSAIAIFMSDLADMLKQSEKYSVIVVNPFTELEINMPIEAFLRLFEEPDDDNPLKRLIELFDAIKKHSVELEENTTLFISSDENFMIENAVDGVFVHDLPLHASSSPKHAGQFKYTNILLMPESKRILPIVSDDDLDVIIAPGTEFKLQDVMDKTQNLWLCGDQPFYDEKNGV